jgi:iron complex transport system substrate-binding protein
MMVARKPTRKPAHKPATYLASFVQLIIAFTALCVSSAAQAQIKTQTLAKDVIVIGGGLTEIVYALGAEHRIAATDTTALYPEAATKLPKVGYQRALSAEGVLALKPSLILAAGEAGPAAALSQIRSAGVRIEQFESAHTTASVIDNVERVARLLSMPQEGERLVGQLKTAVAQMQTTIASYRGARPKAIFLLAHSAASSQVSGEGTAAHAMIELAGGENAMKGFTGYRPLTAEGIASAAPDVILISNQGLQAQGGIEGLLNKPGIALTPAGRAKRIVSMDALQLLGFTPRLPQTVVALAQSMRDEKAK